MKRPHQPVQKPVGGEQRVRAGACNGDRPSLEFAVHPLGGDPSPQMRQVVDAGPASRCLAINDPSNSPIGDKHVVRPEVAMDRIAVWNLDVSHWLDEALQVVDQPRGVRRDWLRMSSHQPNLSSSGTSFIATDQSWSVAGLRSAVLSISSKSIGSVSHVNGSAMGVPGRSSVIQNVVSSISPMCSNSGAG